MKTAFYAWVVCGITSVVPALQAQILPPLEGRVSESTRSDEARALEDLATIAHARASDAASMERVLFSEECVTVSEPSNRMLFEHEENVNSFLSIGAKFGMGRLLIVHMSHPRLATHGGVAKSPMAAYNAWNENGHRYALARPWGMIGDLEQPQPKAYLFRPSPYMREDGKKHCGREGGAQDRGVCAQPLRGPRARPAAQGGEARALGTQGRHARGRRHPCGDAVPALP